MAWFWLTGQFLCLFHLAIDFAVKDTLSASYSILFHSPGKTSVTDMAWNHSTNTKHKGTTAYMPILIHIKVSMVNTYCIWLIKFIKLKIISFFPPSSCRFDKWWLLCKVQAMQNNLTFPSGRVFICIFVEILVMFTHRLMQAHALWFTVTEINLANVTWSLSTFEDDSTCQSALAMECFLDACFHPEGVWVCVCLCLSTLFSAWENTA